MRFVVGLLVGEVFSALGAEGVDGFSLHLAHELALIFIHFLDQLVDSG